MAIKKAAISSFLFSWYVLFLGYTFAKQIKSLYLCINLSHKAGQVVANCIKLVSSSAIFHVATHWKNNTGGMFHYFLFSN